VEAGLREDLRGRDEGPLEPPPDANFRAESRSFPAGVPPPIELRGGVPGAATTRGAPRSPLTSRRAAPPPEGSAESRPAGVPRGAAAPRRTRS
jgi:hypothetical protein